MTTFKFGLVHAPLTPFTDGKINYQCYGNLLDFHLRHGAEGLALPTHVGESVSLTVEERKALLEFAVKHVAGRAPVIANVSEAGTAIGADLATHAREAGAAALIVMVPYYWTPPQQMLVEHIAAIGNAGGLPLFVLNAPAEMADVEFASKSVVELLDKLPEFAGLIDASLDWQYMIEVVTVARAARPGFQFISGSEYLISAYAVGATGVLSGLASVAPQLMRDLNALCLGEKFAEARASQEDAAILFRALRDAGVPGLKALSRFLGRDCGDPRPPLLAFSDAQGDMLLRNVAADRSLAFEPRGFD